MRRALVVGTGTVAGVAAVLGFNPAHTTGSGTPAARTGTGTRTTTGSGQTVAGDAVDVGYGTVQVQVTVSGGKVTDITALALPDGDRHSSRISAQAFPILVRQALAAQSAQVDGVSGATFTTRGFEQSLASALSRAGIG